MISEVMHMTDKNKTPQEEQQISKMRKLSRKRWFYPAVYLCAAAIVMIGSLWIQHSMSNNQHKDNKGQVAINKDKNDAVPVNSAKEVFQWPVTNKDNVKVAVPFYDVNADADQQAAALVNYNNSYVTSKGICLVANDNKSFDVAASMSGKVVKAEKDDLLGYVVEIEHANGIDTVYESLGTIAVEKGQTVQQGEVIGTAGTDKYMKDLGVHLHFEIRKDGVAVDPQAYFLKGLASLESAKISGDKASEKNTNDQISKDNKNNMENNMNNDSNMDRSKDDSKTKENSTSPDESSTSTDQSDQTDASNS
jgi:stage II sporulation protein Q